MALTRPRPSSTDAIVKVIRREVPKPEPETMWKVHPSDQGNCWRIGLDSLGRGSCPMGLCLNSTTQTPVFGCEFGYDIPSDQVLDFGNWWDEQTDAQAALDDVWQEEA